ncbi:MAG: sugar phosphate isomerase/epimerase [Candidatus Brocadiaceae bacterium]|jgi:sugar phosphate isomerase/epimerase
MAIACSTSAFRTPLDEALSNVTKLGFQHVDILANPGWDHINTDGLADDWRGTADRVARLLEEHALTPVALNVAVGNLHERSEDANRDRERCLEGLTRLMSRLGIGLASFYPGFRADERRWADVLRDTLATWEEMKAVAAGQGVEFCIELHKNTPFETLRQCTELLDSAPEMRIAYDPSHFVMQGMDVRETAPLLERAAHVHLRDAAAEKMQEQCGRGSVDFAWLLDALEDRHYAGHYSIEYLGGADWDVTDDILRLKEMLEERSDG